MNTNQYTNICMDAFNAYSAKLNKSTKYVIMEKLLLFMVIPRKTSFTQPARYGTVTSSVTGRPFEDV